MLYMQCKDELQAEQWDEVKAIEQQFNALSDEQRSQCLTSAPMGHFRVI